MKMRGKSAITLQSGGDKIPIQQIVPSTKLTTSGATVTPLQQQSSTMSGCIITTANTLPLTTAATLAAAAAATASASIIKGSPQTPTTTTTSPLKIESVVPVRSRNINKSIHRSFSTLGSSSYVPRPYDKYLINNNNNNDSTKQKNVQNLNDGNNNMITTMTTTTNNGFWRIQRSQKEKEKLPDRINMDRRGLTALPIIEDEPNLRLLSLQHNLINSFFVPEVVQQNKQQQQQQQQHPQLSIVMANNNNNNNITNTSQVNESLNSKKPINTTQNHHVKRQQHTIQKSLSSRNLYFPTNSNSGTIGNKSITQSNVGGNVAINVNSSTSASLITTSNQKPTNKNAYAQKSILLNNARGKYVLRKSNSFLNNYSHHTMTASSKLHLNRLLMLQNNTNNNRLNSNHQLDVSGGHENEFNNKSVTSNTNGIIQQSSIITSAPSMSSTNHQAMDELIIRNENFMGFADSLQNLVFLDLYDNQIEKIANLDGLKSLTVLLLGKNRIIDISGIVSVKNTLRVLDLHGNKITNISQRINQLQELKSLNLAGNNLKQIHGDDFKGLFNLKELNVKRNKIKRIIGFDDLRNLERLWLCHNDLQKVDDMSSIAKALNLKEITIENNPVSLAGDCVSFLVSYLPNLLLLSQMHVTEQVRRAAMAWRKSKESSDLNYSHLTNNLNYNIRREEVISNARTNWELLRAQQQHQHQQHPQHHSQHSHPHQQQQQNQMGNKMVNTNQTQKSRHSAQNHHQQQQQQQQPHQNPITETIDTDLLSNLSDNIHIDKKLIRQKTAVINNGGHNKTTKRMIKMNRSSSQDNHQSTNTNNINNNNNKLISFSTDDLFRLPPILAAPFLDATIQIKPQQETSELPTTSENIEQQELFDNNNNNIEKLNDGYSSGSSLGPNIDSSSSYKSSDADEPDQQKLTTNQMKNVKVDQTNDSTGEGRTEIYNIETNKLENDNETSKADENIKTIESLTDACESDNKPSNVSINSNKAIVTDQSSCNNDDGGGGGGGQTNIITSNDQIRNNNNTNGSNKSVNNNNNNNNSAKCKSVMSNRKHPDRTLIRSQTVKNSQTLIRQQSIQGTLPSSSSSSSTSTSSSINNNNNNGNGQANNGLKTNQKSNVIGSNPLGASAGGPTTTTTTTTTTTSTTLHANINHNEREREQGGDYLIEICGRYLNVYGTGAIKFIDRQWNAQKANDVHTIKFNYVNFNNIIIVLNRIKIRFPNVENLIFRETNINALGQLNALAEVQGLHTLVIDPEGNLICQKNWRLYAVYRLSHWGLKQINGIDINETEIQLAQRTYAGLSDLVLWSLPDSLLEPLIARLRLDESYSASKQTPKQWLMQLDPSLKHVVGKEALQCKKSNLMQFSIYHNNNNNNNNHPNHPNYHDEQLLRQKGKAYFSMMMENTCNAVEKLQKLETLWPNLLIEMIRNTLLDYSQIDGYVKNLLSEMLKQ